MRYNDFWQASGLLRFWANRARFHKRRSKVAEDKTYSAVYVGSGTFIISKPKRKPNKLRQSRLKNPQRGARK